MVNSGSLRVAAHYADAVVSLGEEGKGIEESLPVFRARMAKVDELCVKEGRDPASLRHCHFAGCANEPIFASVEATADLIGRYVDAGATDFTFYLHNAPEPLPRRARRNASHGDPRAARAGGDRSLPELPGLEPDTDVRHTEPATPNTRRRTPHLWSKNLVRP